MIDTGTPAPSAVIDPITSTTLYSVSVALPVCVVSGLKKSV